MAFIFFNGEQETKLILYDGYGWGNLEPRKEYNKDKFIDEFTYAYEDI
jgi:hypothetical protein